MGHLRDLAGLTINVHVALDPHPPTSLSSAKKKKRDDGIREHVTGCALPRASAGMPTWTQMLEGVQ